MSASIPSKICVLFGAAACLLACTFGAGERTGRLSLSSADGERIDQLSQVPRLVLRGAIPFHGEDLWWIRGKISTKQIEQLALGAVGQELEERRIPLAVWTAQDGIMLAPLVILEPSQDYTVVALGVGEVALVGTSPTPTPVWWRWGGPDVPPGGWLIHCTDPPPWAIARPEEGWAVDESVPDAPLRGVLEPGGVEVDILRGLTEDDQESDPGCIRFRAPEAEGPFLPPHRVLGRSFEPSAILVSASSGQDRSEPAGVRVSASAAFLETSAPLAEFWVGRAGSEGNRASPRFRAQTAGRSALPLGQFAKGSYFVALTTFDASGDQESSLLSFEVVEERGHPILTEVLANPLGPEPECEWVELVNTGRAPVSLEGYVLEDGSGETPLPAVVLPAGGVGLVVGEGFVVGSSGDVVPSAEAIAVPVVRVGTSGLANSGEAIRLVDPNGEVVSEVPAQPSAAGTSIARRHLLAPDWPTSFGPHAAPGASPGAANGLE